MTPFLSNVEIPDAVAHITLGDIFTVLLFISGVLGALLVVRKVLKPFVDALQNFLSDWNGEPERPGVDRRLGVMERFEVIERTLAGITHEVKPNDGGSMHDKINRIETQVTGDQNDTRAVARDKK